MRGCYRNHPYYADVVEIISSRPNERVPASVAEMLFIGIRCGWQQDGGVRGDEGEMLAVVVEVVRRCGCRCGVVV